MSFLKIIKKKNGKIFDSKKEAKKVVQNIKRNYPFFRGFRLDLSYEKNHYKIQMARNRKGKFILATNIYDDKLYPAEKIFNSYKSRNGNIEAEFKLFKDSAFLRKGLYLKWVDRIQAIMVVMALILFIHNLGEYVLRKNLKHSKRSHQCRQNSH
ncbi:MAG: hypothetical protein HOE90_05215 [Bacteriovoracaceae bacterium]|nr:hypothetical protein [Bacteriovoracaceae bacterium]